MPEVILPCPACGGDDTAAWEYVVCKQCYARGPICKTREAAIDAWNALPRMSAIIAWQFQAAGLALALQRLMDAAHTMRNAQEAFEQYGSNEDSMAEAEAVFDGLLDDLRRKTGGHHA